MEKALAKVKLKQLEDSKVDQLELKQKRQENTALLNRVITMQGTISDLEVQVANKKVELINQQLQVSNREQKVSQKETEISELKAEVKKQKRRKVFAWIVTGGVTAGAVYVLSQ